MKRIAAIVLIGTILLTGCTRRSAQPQTYRFPGAFGGTASITARTTDGTAFLQAAQRAQEDLTHMSALLGGGETGHELGLDAVNRFAGQNAVQAAPEVMRYAQELNLWRQRWPDDAEALPLSAVNATFNTIALSAGTMLPGGEIARGYALDYEANSLLPQLQATQATPTPIPTITPASTAAANATPDATLGMPTVSVAPVAMDGLLLTCGGGARAVGATPPGRGWAVPIEAGGQSRTLWLKTGGACILTRDEKPSLQARALAVTAADALTAALLCEQLSGLSIEQGRELLRTRSIASAVWVLDNGSLIRYGSIVLTKLP